MTKASPEKMEAIVYMIAIFEQMNKCLLAGQEEMLARMQEKMDANTKATQEDIKSGKAEMRSIVGAIEEKMDVWIANIRDDWKRRMSYQETTESRLECEEPISVDMKACQETTACHEAMETDTEKI
jgi:hypothetical protein